MSKYICFAVAWVGGAASSASAMETTLRVQTDEAASCRGCQADGDSCHGDTTFDTIESMGFTLLHVGSDVHEHVVEVECNANYRFYVRCEASGVTST